MRLSVKSCVSTNAICSRHTKPSWVTVLPFLTCCTTSSAVKSCLDTFTTGTTSPTPLSSQSLSNSKPPSQCPFSSQLVIRPEGDCLVFGNDASKPPNASRSLVSTFSALAEAALLTSKKPRLVSKIACVRLLRVKARGSKSSVICSFNSCFSLRPTLRASLFWISKTLSSKISRITPAGSTFSSFFKATRQV